MFTFYLSAHTRHVLRPPARLSLQSDAMANSDFEASPLAPRTTPEEQVRDRDLGFGAVVGRQSRQRLLNADGSFNVKRTGLGWLASAAPYQQLLRASWGGFFATVVVSYAAFNVLFA